MPRAQRVNNKLFQKRPLWALLLAALLFLVFQLISNNNGQSTTNVNVNQTIVEEDLKDEIIVDEPVGFTGTKNMNVCKGNSEVCNTRKVEFENGEVIMIYLSDTNIIAIDYSDCEGTYCYAEDEDGGEWDLVE